MSPLLLRLLFFFFFSLRCTRRVNDIRRERGIPNGSPLRAFHFFARSPARYSRAPPRGLTPVHGHPEKQSRIRLVFIMYMYMRKSGLWNLTEAKSAGCWIRIKQRTQTNTIRSIKHELNTFHIFSVISKGNDSLLHSLVLVRDRSSLLT